MLLEGKQALSVSLNGKLKMVDENTGGEFWERCLQPGDCSQCLSEGFVADSDGVIRPLMVPAPHQYGKTMTWHIVD